MGARLLSMTAYRAAEQPSYGRLILERAPRGGGTAIAIAIICIGGLIDIGALLVPPRTVNGWIIVAIWGGLFPLFAAIAALGRKADRARLFEEALIIGAGTRARVIPWSSITELRTRRMIGGRRSTGMRSVLDVHTLKLADGSVVDARFAFADNDEVLAALYERARAPMLEGARARVAAGERVTFGAIALDREGLYANEKTYPWSAITHVSFAGPEQSVVVHTTTKEWIEHPLHDVPNAHVLAALVGELARGAATTDAAAR